MAELINMNNKHALATGKALPAKNGYTVSLADATSAMGLAEGLEAHDQLVAQVERAVADMNATLAQRKK